MMNLAWLYLRLAVAVMFLFGCNGCAHVQQTTAACIATPANVDAVFNVLQNPSQAAAIAAVDGLGLVACVAKSAVDQIIASLEPRAASGTTQALVVAESTVSPVLANAKAWRAAHP